jgi:hypothetical protein
MRRLAIIAAVALATAAPARAEFISGSTLLQRIEASERIQRGTSFDGDEIVGGFATGFVIGVYDVYVGQTFCSRRGLTVGQVVAVAALYLRAIPHRHNEVAYDLVREAFDRAWPCERPQRQQAPSRNL